MMECTKMLIFILLSCIGETSWAKSFWLDETNDDCDKQKLEIFPGLGWDSLRGKEMAPVFNFTYTSCRQTTDGEFMIPGEVSVTPIRKSDVTVSSELIKHWSNYTDVTAKSVNLGLGLGFENTPLLSLLGSFSDGYTNMKREQLKHSGLMSRTAVRHEIYGIRIAPEAEIVPELKKRLDRAIYEQMRNESEVVECILEFIIRDFGTHFIKSVVAGGVLYREDFVDDKILTDRFGNEDMLKLAAQADFASKVKLLSASYGALNSRTALSDYTNHLISSTEKSVGGDPLKLRASVNEWTSTVLKKMGTIDRVGDPLFTLLTATHFPDDDEKILQKVGSTFKESIENYYRHNAHEGCMQMTAPNFDPNANINNGQCKNPLHNYKFGGIFKICEHDRDSEDCEKSINQKNPITGRMACPNGYATYKLFGGKQIVVKEVSECEQKCTGWIWKDCKDECHQVEKSNVYGYETYWCGAKRDVDRDTGYMFGGILDTATNDLQHCPQYFYPLKLTARINVCVSNDYSVGFKNSIAFGGFFSCSSTNPIADGRRGCPEGFEQLLVGLIEECEVKYCVRIHRQESSDVIDIKLVRPPYKTLVQTFMASNPNQCYKDVTTTTTPIPVLRDVESDGQVMANLIRPILIAFGVALFIIFVILCYVWRRMFNLALKSTYSHAVDYILIPTSNGCKASKEFLTTSVAQPTGTFLANKIITPVVGGVRKSIDFTKDHVGDPMKLAWVKMRSRCMGSPNLSVREDSQFLSPDHNAVLVDVAPKSANPFSSSEHHQLIDNDSCAVVCGDTMYEKSEGATTDGTLGYKILPFYDCELLN